VKGLRRKKNLPHLRCLPHCNLWRTSHRKFRWTFNHRRTFARFTTNKTLRSAQRLSPVAIFKSSQCLFILSTSQSLPYTEYCYRLWDQQHIATCVSWRLAFCVSMCIANLITNFYKTSRWWEYRKLRCGYLAK
jgi:hypothetical protein